jgi:hypothetical protein
MNIEHNNAHPQSHTMTLVTTHDSGAEEWLCPTCGRRFLMHWPPDYKKTVLEPGDESATHSGGKGGISMRPPQVLKNLPAESIDLPEALEGLPEVVEDEPGLANWAEQLDKINFESLWK